MNILDFGTILRELRESAGMTQKQLAQKIGVSKSSISLYELHQRLPSPDVLSEIGRVFHVSIEYLLGIDKVERADLSGLDEEDVELVHHLIDVLRKKNHK